MKFITKSQNQTKKLGEKIAKDILKKYQKTNSAVVLKLIGELGSGKTTFLQGFAKGLGIKGNITSPTFILMKKYPILPICAKKDSRIFTDKNLCKFINFYHIDCYRIQKPKEILALGLKEIILNNKNIVAIEWADRILKLLPKNSILIKFEFLDEKKRKITIKNF